MNKDQNNNISQIRQLPPNNYPFDTQMSQDPPLDDKNSIEFAPWVRKKTNKNNNDNNGSRMTHGFLSKLNLPSKLPKMPESSQQKKQQINEQLIWLKKNLKNKINNQRIRNSETIDDPKYSSRYRFSGNHSSLYRKKVLKLYRKPKSIELSLEQNFQHQNMRITQNSFTSPPVLAQKVRNRRENQNSSKKQKRSYNFPQSRETIRNSILQTQKKFYQTLQLKVNRQPINEPKRKKIMLPSQNSPRAARTPSESFRLSEEKKKLDNKIFSDEVFACEGKKISNNQYYNHRQRIKNRLLFRNKEDQQKIFLS